MLLLISKIWDRNPIFCEILAVPLTGLLCIFFLYLSRNITEFLRLHSYDISQKILLTADILLTLCCTIQFTSYWIDKRYSIISTSMRYGITLSFILILVLLLIYVNGKCKELEERQLREQKELQLDTLESYVTQVEALYDELRGFRHDYRNVLVSMNESIQTEDISTIKSTYNNVLANEGITLDDTHHSLTKLNHLKTLPIKGIVSTHIIQAWQKELTVNIEVEENIENEAIDTLDYVRILSVLLTNAIEAAEVSEQKNITVAFFLTEENTVHIIIENSYASVIDSSKIFERGYSTKGENRGIGLSNVTLILDNYDNVFLQTEVTEDTFSQHLIIRG